jgi:hypothetical protein
MFRSLQNFLLTVWLMLVHLPAFADHVSGQVWGVAYVFSDSGLGYFHSDEVQWSVRCSEGGCDARGGLIVLHLDENGLSIDSDLDGEISVWHNRTAQPLHKDQPLAQFERATLLSSKNVVVTDSHAPSIEVPSQLSTDGIKVVLLFMELWQGLETVETPTSHLALSDGQNASAPAQLVPFTKPQIEFAIRSQTQLD